MLVTMRVKNEKTGESLVTGFVDGSNRLIACLSNRHGLFRMGVGDDPGFEARDALEQDWRARGDAISITV